MDCRFTQSDGAIGVTMLRLKFALLMMLLVSSIVFSQEADQASGKNDQAGAQSVAEDKPNPEKTDIEKLKKNHLDGDPLADRNGDGIASPKTMSGMSILGNEEAPKSLIIIPWKSSELGDTISLSGAPGRSIKRYFCAN